jgi:anti-sigma regulatory factor (Ser/Thr protein kinase)
MASDDRPATTGAAAGDAQRGRWEAPVPPADVALDQTFDRNGLYALRSAVAAHATELGLNGRRVADLVLIANELASNAIRHGGSRGRLRLWRDHKAVHCQVSDRGPGLVDPEHAGTTQAAIAASGGRGLWIIRQLCDHLDISSDSGGATLTATLNVPTEPGESR